MRDALENYERNDFEKFAAERITVVGDRKNMNNVEGVNQATRNRREKVKERERGNRYR